MAGVTWGFSHSVSLGRNIPQRVNDLRVIHSTSNGVEQTHHLGYEVEKMGYEQASRKMVIGATGTWVTMCNSGPQRPDPAAVRACGANASDPKRCAESFPSTAAYYAEAKQRVYSNPRLLPLRHRKWPERWIETPCRTDEDSFCPVIRSFWTSLPVICSKRSTR